MKFLRKFRSWFRRGKLEAEMTEEMQAHVNLQTERNQAAGMGEEEARYAALRQFGNVAGIQEQVREQRGWFWLEQFRQDFGYAVRQLLKFKGFSVTVIVTLALGIGACTVVFTAVNSTLLHPMAGDAVDRDVILHETQMPARTAMGLAPPTFLDVERVGTSFETVAAWASTSMSIQGDVEPLQLRGAAITPGCLTLWGSQAELGRSFSPDEFSERKPVVMIGYSLWQRAFGGSPSVIGRAIDLNGTPTTVVGVISPRFAKYGSDIDLWIPLIFDDRQRAQQRGAHYLAVFGRLKHGVTLQQAQAEMNVLATDLARQYPDTNKGGGILVREFGSYLNRNLAPMLYLLLGAVGCVMLIACANVANLLLARATARQREMSVRAALGAGRGRLVRQLLVESLLLASLGGGGGILLAQWGLRFVRFYGPSAGTDLARLAYIELDPAVLAFTLGFSLLTGIAFGLAPAWLGSRVNLSDALKQGSRGSSSGGLRNLLVIVEVSLAFVLLTAAGLLVRSFSRLAHVDPGFSTRQVATMRLGLNNRKYNTVERRRQFTDALLEKVRALPGVETVAVSGGLPIENGGLLPFEIMGAPSISTQTMAAPNFVTADYFQALGIRLLRGQLFDPRESASAPPAFVINETLARLYFPNEDPLGRTLSIGFGPGLGNFGQASKLSGEIIGVVADIVQGSPGSVPAQFYLPWRTVNLGGFNLMVRTSGDPHPVLSQLKSQVYALDRSQPTGAVRTLEEQLGDIQARPHFMLMLLGIYGLIALVIAAVGIYGVMSYSVSQRTMEFGIRAALGANRAHVLRQVLWQGLKVTGIGLLLGLLAALAMGWTLQSLLYQTDSRDPVTLGAIMFLLLAVSFVACWLPARRATKVDPMVALRAE